MTELYATARSLWVVWLMILFIGIIWWVYRPRNRRRFEEAAKIPLREDDGGTDGKQ
ncbi:MAG: cbb3-type cytochrome c oxidase subunit 3 [Rhodospirillales bacterium]|nr:cbb3-type cytochrome c oxidase subunit 3 [Rhodospirillales bacterium]